MRPKFLSPSPRRSSRPEADRSLGEVEPGERTPRCVDRLGTERLRLFDDRGFEATTVESICAQAEVAVSTFYAYFESKEATAFPDEDARAALVAGEWREPRPAKRCTKPFGAPPTPSSSETSTRSTRWPTAFSSWRGSRRSLRTRYASLRRRVRHRPRRPDGRRPRNRPASAARHQRRHGRTERGMGRLGGRRLTQPARTRRRGARHTRCRLRPSPQLHSPFIATTNRRHRGLPRGAPRSLAHGMRACQP
jgi:AcrR family transcriptional regulator